MAFFLAVYWLGLYPIETLLFGLTFCYSKCFCSKFINFLACYLHSQKCQYWVLDLNQLILSIIVELKGMSDCPCCWSHVPKNLLSDGLRYDSKKKKLIIIFDLERHFWNRKSVFLYWLLIWQHIKSLHLECLKTKEPYIGPVYKLPSDWSYIFAVLAGFVLCFQIVESYIPIFLDP